MQSVTQTVELGIRVHETKLMLCVWHSECQNISRLNERKFETKKEKRKVKSEIANTEDQILFLALSHVIAPQDLSPLTLLFLVYICTHVYK